MKKRTILGILFSVDSVLEIPLKRKLALRCCHVTTYSENRLLLESFLVHISEWMRDECRTILGILFSVDSVLEIPLKRKLALRCCHVTTYSENRLLLESFLVHISEWMRDECRCSDTDITNERYSNISSKHK